MAQSRAEGASRMPSGAGPGAGVPKRVSSRRQARWASSTVTFCSRTAGISDSSTSPVRTSRSPGWRRWASRSTGCAAGSKPEGSSSAPSSAGRRSSSQSAPGPHACAPTSPSPGLTVTRSVPGPPGVREARHSAPSEVAR